MRAGRPSGEVARHRGAPLRRGDQDHGRRDHGGSSGPRLGHGRGRRHAGGRRPRQPPSRYRRGRSPGRGLRRRRHLRRRRLVRDPGGGGSAAGAWPRRARRWLGVGQGDGRGRGAAMSTEPVGELQLKGIADPGARVRSWVRCPRSHHPIPLPDACEVANRGPLRVGWPSGRRCGCCGRMRSRASGASCCSPGSPVWARPPGRRPRLRGVRGRGRGRAARPL